jgi:uridine kinase
VLAARIAELAAGRATPLIVALDGRAGTGKSTVAAALARECGWPVIDGDDFYAGGTAEQWDAMSPAQRADHCIDWRRQRPVLEALARGEPASWRPYDWEAFDGRLSDDVRLCEPAAVVILEGMFSARPELDDLVAFRVCLDLPQELRRARLLEREGDGFDPAWWARWDSAEEHYFAHVMSLEAFDLVLSSGG